LDGARGNCCQRIGNCQTAVVMGVNSQRCFYSFLDRRKSGCYLFGKEPAAGVAQDDFFRAGFFGRLDGF